MGTIQRQNGTNGAENHGLYRLRSKNFSLRCHPTFFFSGALSPVPDLPGPVRLNPLSYGVDGLRGALSGSFAFGAATDLAVLGSLAVFCLGSALIYSRTSRCNDG